MLFRGIAECIKIKAMSTHTNSFSLLRTLLVAFSMLVTGVAFAQTEESALKMVRELRLGQNLGDMSYRLSKVTTTYQGLAGKVGPQKADEMLRAELSISVPRHQDQWDRSLAKAWAPLMTSNEFDSVAAEKQKSPYAAKFSSLQNQAGAAMKADSEKLLVIVMTEALNRAFERSSGHK
jgi:hypothetical protein